MSNADLVRDTQKLNALLPPDIDAIAGVTRSGMVPATLIAMARHLPLYEINPEQGLRQLGSGWRLTATDDPRRVAVIDDTVASGQAMRSLQQTFAGLFDNGAVSAVVYASPEARGLVDFYAVDLPQPHYLEWNLFNSVYSSAMAVDFDGILCEDCPAELDDDGPGYLHFLETAKPKYLPRRDPIPLIVTARLEKYRPQTLAWLARHDIRVERLEMHTAADFEQRREAYDAGEFKGRLYRESPCTLFVESDYGQAEQIAAASGKRVICPDAGEVIG